MSNSNYIQVLDNEYNGDIKQEILLSENEDMICRYRCFKAEDDRLYWNSLILTNKKIIILWNKQVEYIYLRSIKTVELTCFDERDRFYVYDNNIRVALDQGYTPYSLKIDLYSIFLDNEDNAMELLDEINRLICD